MGVKKIRLVMVVRDEDGRVAVRLRLAEDTPEMRAGALRVALTSLVLAAQHEGTHVVEALRAAGLAKLAERMIEP